MKKIFFSAIIIFVTATSCNSNHNSIPNSTVVTDKKIDSFFAVTSFIKGQMLSLDSFPVTPLHTIRINNKTDSIWIKKADLIPLLSGFLTPEIKETNLINYFKEASFNDQTLNAITFTYDPVKVLPDSISLRHWDIYIDPASGNISKVYIVKQFKKTDSIVTQQLTWKTNKWATITTLLNKPGDNTQVLKEEKFTWDFNE